ncbi:hypothetical protein SDC9_201074 [bioreactor metagenome]|uniref:Uncharacterized protein n=1 Tax=bioreactor metagenome TaxID=1076179 RepID=A0A645IR33_9ZZZZ
MGNVADEIPPVLVRVLNGFRHKVEGVGQIADFILGGYQGPLGEVALAHLVGHAVQFIQGTNQDLLRKVVDHEDRGDQRQEGTDPDDEEDP